MTASTLEHTVFPPNEPLDELVAMLRTFSAADPSTTLSGPNGQHLILPAEVFEVLRDIVEAMAAGQAVTIAPVHQRLTTQEAADLLGVSRHTREAPRGRRHALRTTRSASSGPPRRCSRLPGAQFARTSCRSRSDGGER